MIDTSNLSVRDCYGLFNLVRILHKCEMRKYRKTTKQFNRLGISLIKRRSPYKIGKRVYNRCWNIIFAYTAGCSLLRKKTGAFTVALI